MVLSEQNGQKNPLRQDCFLNGQILRETERREPPGPEPDAALESILRDRRAGAAFLKWYRDEIIQFWEGHCQDA